MENQGGMTKAIEMGLPKIRIEEAAAKRQANIDSGKEIIVGLNAYESPDDQQVDILEIDNKKEIFRDPQHHYTRKLLDSIPKITIRNEVA